MDVVARAKNVILLCIQRIKTNSFRIKVDLPNFTANNIHYT